MSEPVTECAFCAKTLREVRKMIVSEKVGICDECIGLSIKLIAEDAERLRTDRKVLLGALKAVMDGSHDCARRSVDGDDKCSVCELARKALARAEAP